MFRISDVLRNKAAVDRRSRMGGPAATPGCGTCRRVGVHPGPPTLRRDRVVRLGGEPVRRCTGRTEASDSSRRRIAAHDDERARLVHGDVHQWNALESGDGFKLVDPDGLPAEPEYDLGMREDPVELLEEGPWNRAHRQAALTGLDTTAIWEWGVVERVSTGLLCTQIDLQPHGDDMLATAEVVAGL